MQVDGVAQRKGVPDSPLVVGGVSLGSWERSVNPLALSKTQRRQRHKGLGRLALEQMASAAGRLYCPEAVASKPAGVLKP